MVSSVRKPCLQPFLLYATCSHYRIKTNLMASFTIGQLSRETGVNTETIRYFEKVGLLSSPPRTGGGHRIYGEDPRRTVGFIPRARELGFTPGEVSGYLALGGPADARRPQARTNAAHPLPT